jgi:hypothetical protein
MELFTLRELQALEGTLTRSLSGRTNDLMWTATEHLALIQKVQKLVAEREDLEFCRETLSRTEPETGISAST